MLARSTKLKYLFPATFFIGLSQLGIGSWLNIYFENVQ